MLLSVVGFMNIHLEYLISDNTEFQLYAAVDVDTGMLLVQMRNAFGVKRIFFVVAENKWKNLVGRSHKWAGN